MGSAVTRIAGAILGFLTLLLALLLTLGTAILVPIGMMAAGFWARRTGRSLTPMQRWLAGVLPFAAIVIVGLGAGTAFGPLRGVYDKFNREIVEAQKHPPPQPAYMRQLNLPPPAPLPASVATPLTMWSTIIGVEFWCLFCGTLAWGGASLLAAAVRGPIVVVQAREPDGFG